MFALFRSTPTSSVLTRASRSVPSLANQAAAANARRGMARITITGHVGQEPELVPTSTGREIVKYTVASSYGAGENRKTSWFHITSFVGEGRARERLLGLTKGSQVLVEGDVSLGSYEDAEGKKRSSMSIVHRSMEVLRRRAPAGLERQQEVPEAQPATEYEQEQQFGQQ